MYSGLLPKGFTEDDLSPDDDEDEAEEQREGEQCESSAEKLSSVGENTVSVKETQSTHTACESDNESPTCSMPGISQEMWQDLRKKKEKIKTTKVPQKRKRRRHKKGTNSEETTETREHQEEHEQHWNELKQHFGVNDRFHPPACSKPPPKSGLEKSIEGAIAEGDIAKAEEMSDRLATREAVGMLSTYFKVKRPEMESFYTEIKHYVLNGGYHDLTIAAEKPDTRKALIRRASKQYLIK
ncbi:hypothetical protein KUCAC02_024584, partial [Chaenocephalus aceratus]